MGFIGVPGFLTLTVLVTFWAYIAMELDIDPVAHVLKEPLVLTGSMAPNDALEKAEKLAEGLLQGPESLTVRKGEVYTGQFGGNIVKLENGKLKTVANIADHEKCSKNNECGYPRGMRFGHKDDLYVVDNNYGLVVVNVTTGGLKTLFLPDKPVNERKVMVLNDMDISTEGDIYMSDSTTKWTGKDMLIEFLEMGPNGRVLHYDPRTATVSELVSGLHFANGVQLSPKQDYLVVAECTAYRLLKVYLKGPKKGTVEVLADNLPGMPDNVRASSSGGYWVGIIATRFPGQYALPILDSYPLVRKIIARTIYVIEKFFTTIGPLFPQQIRDTGAQWLPNPGTMKSIIARYGLVIEINEQGEIIRSLHSDGNTWLVSHAMEEDGYLYTGSPWNRFIGKIKL